MTLVVFYVFGVRHVIVRPVVPVEPPPTAIVRRIDEVTA